jgi:hypothetical protein
MPEAKKKLDQLKSDLGLDGFEKIFDQLAEAQEGIAPTVGTEFGDSDSLDTATDMAPLLKRFSEIVALSVDQRIENARISAQLIDNQRQLVATQQILIRLMEKSIELTRHISDIEEKLPTVFALPRTVESLRDRLVKLEGIEID